MGGFITFPHTILNKPFTWVKLEILLDEDWEDSFAINEGERPLDLTGMRLELYCRPAFGHPTLIKKLTTDPAAGAAIQIDDPLKGTAYIAMRQADVAATFVAGRWKQFLRLVDVSSGGAQEIWRGELIVHPGMV